MSRAKCCEACLGEYLSSRKLVLMAINGVCFGALLNLIAFRAASGPAVVLTISTGVSFGALLVGAVLATRQAKRGTGR